MHILIVEDEKGIVDFLKQGLEEENYTISTAFDGADGLKKALELPVDLVLLDWMLPKMQGIEVCKNIRTEKSNLPIIFLTAKDTVQETIEGLKAGANDYIKKPFSFEELLERIKIHFRAKDEAKILTLGNITIDKSKFQVLVDNPNLKIQIQGHICCIDKDFRNLSTDRAKQIKRFLVYQGIAQHRIQTKGFGVSQPLFQIPEASEEQAAANRRVEIEILSK